MNRYDPRTPRTLFGFAAVALSAATLALAVIAPVTAAPGTADVDMLTRVESESCVPADRSIITAIDVVAERHAPVAPSLPPATMAQSREAAPRLTRG
jgi:hypothetical protein